MTQLDTHWARRSDVYINGSSSWRKQCKGSNILALLPVDIIL